MLGYSIQLKDPRDKGRFANFIICSKELEHKSFEAGKYYCCKSVFSGTVQHFTRGLQEWRGQVSKELMWFAAVIQFESRFVFLLESLHVAADGGDTQGFPEGEIGEEWTGK